MRSAEESLVSRFGAFEPRQAATDGHLRHECVKFDSSQSLLSRLACSSTTQLNLIRASPSRALASLLHRLEPPVAIVSVNVRRHSQSCPRTSTISIVRCVRGATGQPSQSERTVHALRKCPRRPTFPLSTTSIAPPRDPVTLACSALLAARSLPGPNQSIVAGALVGLSASSTAYPVAQQRLLQPTLYTAQPCDGERAV